MPEEVEPPIRSERYHDSSQPDQRLPAQRDRDRLLYSSAFKRLAGVTQVVAASEGAIFHNRLTHSLKVEQLSRRLAEHLWAQPTERDKADAWGGLDPETAAAAALAHDLGHPPFGHIAEKALDRLIVDKESMAVSDESNTHGAPDGFEGNAQSFRIVTRLAPHKTDLYEGLNLTRATLRATLKYPWLRDLHHTDSKQHRKFGAYVSEEPELEFALQLGPTGKPSLEAAIMDYADGLAYSVHDFEDFVRAGLIPVARLLTRAEFDRFMQHWLQDLGSTDPRLTGVLEHGETTDLLHDLLDTLDIGEEYVGTFHQRGRLRQRTSGLISYFLPNVTISPAASDSPLIVDEQHRVQMKFLQRIVWTYVIENPRLATQQAGQTRVVETLFNMFLRATELTSSGKFREPNIIPAPVCHFLYKIERMDNGAEREGMRRRLAADSVCCFTDLEAVSMASRLSGTRVSSVTDLIWH